MTRSKQDNDAYAKSELRQINCDSPHHNRKILPRPAAGRENAIHTSGIGLLYFLRAIMKKNTKSPNHVAWVTEYFKSKLNSNFMKKIHILVFLIYTFGFPLVSKVHAGLPESPRGDSKSNSMETGRQRPYGGGSSKTGQQAHLQSDKYKEERARLDKAYIIKKKNIQQSTKSDLSRLSKQVKTKK